MRFLILIHVLVVLSSHLLFLLPQIFLYFYGILRMASNFLQLFPGFYKREKYLKLLSDTFFACFTIFNHRSLLFYLSYIHSNENFSPDSLLSIFPPCTFLHLLLDNLMCSFSFLISSASEHPCGVVLLC